LLADPGRAYLPKTGLMRLTMMAVACSLELEDRESRDVCVYQIVG
jgi:predicted nicotinamide N-methyase